MKPLNLLILMAEVFFSLSVCFFSFLFLGCCEQGWGQGCQADSQTEPSTSLPLWHQHPLPSSITPCLRASTSHASLLLYVCVCLSLSLSLSLITTHPEPFLSSWMKKKTKKKQWEAKKKRKSFPSNSRSLSSMAPNLPPLCFCLPWGPGTQSWLNAGSQEPRRSRRHRSACAPLRTPALWTNGKTAAGEGGRKRERGWEGKRGRGRERGERQQGWHSNNYWFIGGN